MSDEYDLHKAMHEGLTKRVLEQEAEAIRAQRHHELAVACIRAVRFTTLIKDHDCTLDDVVAAAFKQADYYYPPPEKP